MAHLRLLSLHSADYAAMTALRERVLLAPIGIPASYINPEKEAADFLLGAFDKDRLVACCVLTPREANTVQLRQMAVDSACQGKGLGAALLGFAEAVAAAKGFFTVVLHARQNVTGFYERCGYTVFGEPFDEVGIAHRKMKKDLSP